MKEFRRLIGGEVGYYELKTMTERQIAKLERDIVSAKAKLRYEKKNFGYYDDSYGARYYIAEKYFLLGDSKKSLRYRKWFYKNFANDMGNPELHLFWLIAGFVDGKVKIGFDHLVDLEEMNHYAIPLILGKEVNKIDKWESMNLSTMEYAVNFERRWRKRIPNEIINILAEKTSHPIYLSFKDSLIANDIELANEKEQMKRRIIIQREDEILEDWKQSCDKIF